MCRDIIKFLIGLLIFLGLPLLLLATVFLFRSLDVAYYRQAAAQADIYQVSSELVAGAVIGELAPKKLLAQSGLDLDASGEKILITIVAGLQDEIASAVRSTLSPANIQTIVENNIENTLNYLNGVDAEVTLYIPKKAIMRELPEVSKELIAGVKKYVADLKPCTAADLNRIEKGDYSKPCLPPDFDAVGFTKELEQSSKSLTKQLLEVEFLQGPEQVKLSELTAELPNQNNVDFLQQAFADARTLIGYIKLSVGLLWVLMAMLGLLYLAFASGVVFKRLKGLSFVVVFAMLVALSITLILKVLVVPGIVQQALLATAGYGLPIDTLVYAVSDQMLNPMITVAGAVLLGSVALWLVCSLLAAAYSKWKPTKEQIKESLKEPELVDITPPQASA